MFPWNPNQWTEDFLLTLIGQPESSIMEFKSGRAVGGRKTARNSFVTKCRPLFQHSPTPRAV